ncbi:MAG: hypothetical protein NTZ02_04215 [Candidatus Woesearchaeota archaeon]|nr:hypothetical protein [Candidatus Woesearchaeota archaeon]
MTESECGELDGKAPEQHDLFWKLREIGATKKEADNLSMHLADFYAASEGIAPRIDEVSPERVRELYQMVFESKNYYKNRKF